MIEKNAPSKAAETAEVVTPNWQEQNQDPIAGMSDLPRSLARQTPTSIARGVTGLGDSHLTIDSLNRRIVVNDGTNDLVWLGNIGTNQAPVWGFKFAATGGAVSTNSGIILTTSGVTSAYLTTGYAKRLGYASSTTNFTGSGDGTYKAITGIAATITVPSGSPDIRITGFFPSTSSSTSATISYAIFDGSVTSGVQIAQTNVPGAATGSFGYISANATGLAAGTVKTYTLACQSASGTMTIGGAATGPFYMTVDAIPTS